MSWQPISKPNTSNWANVNPQGRISYDQADITYDSSTTFYDGGDPNSWTKVSRIEGRGLGSLQWQQMFITWEQATQAWNSTSPTWSNVAKPT